MRDGPNGFLGLNLCLPEGPFNLVISGIRLRCVDLGTKCT
jgi:hypothetical protein